MSTEKLIEKIGERTDRAKFLRRLSIATASIWATMLGLAPSAYTGTVRVKCCDLCRQPGGCGYYICIWCWYCCHTDHRQYKCCEYYTAGNCDGSCVNVVCSTIQDWGTCLGASVKEERSVTPLGPTPD